MRLVTLLSLAFLAGSILSAKSIAQDEEEDLYRPGLVGHYTDSRDTTIQRVDRAIGFTWRQLAPDRRLAAGKFRVTWRGYLMSQADGSYRLFAHVAGRVRVRLGNREILRGERGKNPTPTWLASEPIELNFDYHPLEIEYEASDPPARIALFWSGPQFQLEPIADRQFFHDPKDHPTDDFQLGQQLVRAFRCSACHELPGELPTIPAPALDRLAGNVHRAWLVNWLAAPPSPPNDAPGSADVGRRMPHFQMTDDEAESITAYLLGTSLPGKPLEKRRKSPSPPTEKSAAKDKKQNKKKDQGDKEGGKDEKPRSPVELGQELTLTVGCLACHRVNGLGDSGLYGGGDLSRIADKRPREFFTRWLAAPETANVDHRMPKIDLADAEVEQISAYLVNLGARPASAPVAEESAQIERGRKLFAEFRCINCHRAAESDRGTNPTTRSKIGRESNWDRACIGSMALGNQRQQNQPHYAVSPANQRAIQQSVSSNNPLAAAPSRGEVLLAENRCLSCHLRDDSPGLTTKLIAVGEHLPELAPKLPAMTPPPLSSVGDKLHDAALRDAVRRSQPAHRPYLMVRMPKFGFSDSDLQSVLDYLIDADRIPAGAPVAPVRQPMEDATPDRTTARDSVGSRLVTPDGFGCTSCHQVGNVQPVAAPLNARGPNLSLLGQTIRREWYDRWVRNPSRIVPRMEMPSVQLAVRGVLDDDVDKQLAAVWDVLNRPGFEPPRPNPVRTVRHSGSFADRPAFVVTDVIRSGPTTFAKPALIGLSNRHNVLLDLESARLASWSIGDVARQRTEGKSWYWELAGENVMTSTSPQPDLAFEFRGQVHRPRLTGQFLTELDMWQHTGNGVRLRYRLHFEEDAIASHGQVVVTQSFTPLESENHSARNGWRRSVEVSGLAPDVEVTLSAALGPADAVSALDGGGRTWRLKRNDQNICELRIIAPSDARFERDGSLHSKTIGTDRPIRWELDYISQLHVDRFPLEEVPFPTPPIKPMKVVPGFVAHRLPLSDNIMPTGLSWRPDGTLVIASLKGQIWLARDKNHDGLGDELVPFSDDLAAPYGVFASGEYIDVVNKYAVLRLYDDNHDDRADRTVTIASGWGHTTDYHDWAVGLPRDEQGNYYVALPCEQDQRSAAAAYLRGEFLRLVPRQATADDPRLFAIERISRGHRFPMGIARRQDGEIFVTDNQGNYNPFNELNHVRRDAHFGFINAVEKSDRDRPPLIPPAIDIPHPWTRSVNGICFLDTPAAVRQKTGESSFGPFEGHLIGCEYDTRRLIRMTLESVGGTIQGAAYPFSFDQPPDGPPFLGPVVCGVSPA